MARIPASNPSQKIGSVFLNPVVRAVPASAWCCLDFGEALGNLLDGRFDIVGFDPRGVAGSDPLFCFDDADERNAFFEGLPVFTYRNDQIRPFFDRFRRRSLSELLRVV